MEVATKTTGVLRTFRRTKNLQKRRSFLGLWNVYRQIGLIFSRIAAPLSATTKNSEPNSFAADKTELSLMKKLEEKMTRLPLLVFPKQLEILIISFEDSDSQVPSA